MIELILKILALYAFMLPLGFAWLLAAEKDEREFQEYLNSINPYGITKKGAL